MTEPIDPGPTRDAIARYETAAARRDQERRALVAMRDAAARYTQARAGLDDAAAMLRAVGQGPLAEACAAFSVNTRSVEEAVGHMADALAKHVGGMA